jgi:predicted CoA-binding protein
VEEVTGEEMNEPNVIREMLAGKTIAVVGLSENPAKASFGVSRVMQSLGYRIIGVNPAVSGEVLGEKSYASLAELVEAEGKPDIVNVFRLPKFIPAIVDEMIALGLNNLWVQLGIVNEEAAAKAEQAGIRVVMDRCIMVEKQALGFRE